MDIRVIAHAENGYVTKFGVPRQSGLVKETVTRIVFEPEFRVAEAFRGLEGFSHIWVLWEFSEAGRKAGGDWSPTVRPPRLGGNRRIGVFATRSPFRPNPVAMSVVELLGIEETSEGPVILAGGADFMNGTPIYDIKPYIPYADSVPDARGGFTEETEKRTLTVEDPNGELLKLHGKGSKRSSDAAETTDGTAGGNTGDEEDIAAVVADIIAEDPRPAYQDDPERIYGMEYAGYEIKFTVHEKRAIIVKVERFTK